MPWVKVPEPFIRHATNLETRLEDLEGFLTPNERFFVRNHSATPRIEADTYRLHVEGDAAERTLELSLADLRAMPSRSVVAYLECGGNWRGMAPVVLGQTAQGGQWRTGAVGCAEWTGVPLAAVLEAAGVRPGAVDVNLVGLDEAGFERPMTVSKAMDPDTILAYSMNGAPLPADHGFPLRAVVPGWVGSNSIKWLGRVVVSSERIWVRANTSSYVLVGEAWPAEQYAPAEGAPITEQSIKSALALPWPATLAPGPHVLRGFAHGPRPIRSVAWSDDEGRTWEEARIVSPVLPHAWVRFEFGWNATPGDHTVMVRATDAEGREQPMTVPFNEKGYLFNMVLPHPVKVA
jgi:DMSO/TMAO reductase YedYZ molybdopterin-dependent catalytic subunit